MKCYNHGENVRKWRNILSLSQEDLAEKLNIAQPKVSNLEQQEVIDDETLEEISKAIGIPVKLLKECDHEDNMTKIINFINTKSGTQMMIENIEKQDQILNPLEKVSELFERIVQLSIENTKLVEEVKQLRKKK